MFNSKAIVEGAIFISISVVLILISFFFPIFSFLIPVPIIIYTFRNGFKLGVGMVIVNMLILSMFISLYGFLLALIMGTIGITMGSLYRKGEALTSVVGGLIITIADFILLFVLSKYLFGTDIVGEMKQVFLTSLNSSENMLKMLGNSEQTKQVVDAYRSFIETIDQILPFMIISLSLFIVFINHFITVSITKAMGSVIPKFPPFRDWVLPKSVVLYFLISITILMVQPLDQIFALHLIAINLNPLLQLLLIFQGISFVFFYAYHKQSSKVLPVLAIIGSFLPIISEFIIAIGIIDIGFHIRNKIKA